MIVIIIMIKEREKKTKLRENEEGFENRLNRKR